MNNIKTNDSLVGITLLMLTLVSLLALSVNVEARQELVPVEGANYNVNASLTNNLRLLIGKRIYVTLNSGANKTGIVKNVGDKLLHLEKLQDKEFFDALILIDSINSIDTQFRIYKR